MTAEFQYTSRKEMEPRPGVRYATTYYKQSLTEYRLLQQHVHWVAKEIMSATDADSDLRIWSAEPLKAFPKSSRRQHYSLMEIVTDMLTQMAQHKDIPSGILGRWNRLFEATAWDIRMTSGTPARPTTFGQLFDSGNTYGA